MPFRHLIPAGSEAASPRLLFNKETQAIESKHVYILSHLLYPTTLRKPTRECQAKKQTLEGGKLQLVPDKVLRIVAHHQAIQLSINKVQQLLADKILLLLSEVQNLQKTHNL